MSLTIEFDLRVLRHRLKLIWVCPAFIALEIDPCKIKGSNYYRRRWAIDRDGILPY